MKDEANNKTTSEPMSADEPFPVLENATEGPKDIRARLDDMGEAQLDAMSEDEWTRHKLRTMFALIEEVIPTDEELGTLAQVWPLATHLLSSEPMLITVDPWIRSLPDDLFNRLSLLANEFREWNDPGDSATWKSEFCLVAHVLATNERSRRATDDETITAARLLVGVVGIEAQCRTGDYLYSGPYSVVLGQRPQTISAPESGTGH